MDQSTAELLVTQLLEFADRQHARRRRSSSWRLASRCCRRLVRAMDWLVPGQMRFTPDVVLVQDFKVRRWHPGFWWSLFRQLHITVELTPEFYAWQVAFLARAAQRAAKISRWIVAHHLVGLDLAAVHAASWVVRRYGNAVYALTEHPIAGDAGQVAL